jgi:hypothetical protein
MFLPRLFRFKATPPITEESTLSAMKALTERLHSLDLGEVSALRRIQPGASPRLVRLRPAHALMGGLSRSRE